MTTTTTTTTSITAGRRNNTNNYNENHRICPVLIASPPILCPNTSLNQAPSVAGPGINATRLPLGLVTPRISSPDSH